LTSRSAVGQSSDLADLALKKAELSAAGNQPLVDLTQACLRRIAK